MSKKTIIRIIRAAYPQVQGIYRFGSAAPGTFTPNSDIDIAVLLPLGSAKAAGMLSFSDARFALEEALGRSDGFYKTRRAYRVGRGATS
jgi:predicted nucleotidyltransferase